MVPLLVSRTCSQFVSSPIIVIFVSFVVVVVVRALLCSGGYGMGPPQGFGIGAPPDYGMGAPGGFGAPPQGRHTAAWP